MKASRAAACALSVLLVSSTSTRESHAAEPPSPVPPNTATVQRSGGACVIGDHPAELSQWATAMTMFVCDALRKRGVAAGPIPASRAGVLSAYVVTVDRLETTLTVLVTYESPLGTTRRMLWSPIRSLEKPELTADRLAADLTASTSADDIQPDDPRVLGLLATLR